MKKLLLVITLLTVGCATTNNPWFEQIATMHTADLQAAEAIQRNHYAGDKLGLQCTVKLLAIQPEVLQIWQLPTIGPFSKVAKIRAKRIYAEKTYPELEMACGPVLMDIRLRLLRLATLGARIF